ncbi:PCMD domain-containing protein [Prevotella disiens]
MKYLNVLCKGTICLSLILLLGSCIKDEALNKEADITKATLKDYKTSRTPIITNNEVRFYMNGWEDLTKMAPEFELTPGATIDPASGTVRNFLTPQNYIVTSEDGQWKKPYKVSFITDDVATKYHFENAKYYTYTDREGVKKEYFHIFYETTNGKDIMQWGSGNAGYLITHQDAKAEEYPTCQVDGGVLGKCVKLTTKDTGELGKRFKAPIAAGNLFMGTFNIELGNMAKSTHFGLPFRKIPTKLSGYYKYKAGDVYTDKNGSIVSGKRDDFDIYAVLFEVTDDTPYLDGNNAQTSKNIVLFAQLTDKKETNEWTHFVIDFNSVDGRVVDMEKLKDGKYSLAIIMSSSKDGANFNGAVGSTLYVDEMELFTK